MHGRQRVQVMATRNGRIGITKPLFRNTLPVSPYFGILCEPRRLSASRKNNVSKTLQEVVPQKNDTGFARTTTAPGRVAV